MAIGPIAKREFYIVGDKSKKIVIEVFAPRQPKQSGIWECEVRIVGAPEGLDRMVAGGSDSYQALAMGLSILQAMVQRYNKDLGSTMRFQEDTDEDLHLKILQG